MSYDPSINYNNYYFFDFSTTTFYYDVSAMFDICDNIFLTDLSYNSTVGSLSYLTLNDISLNGNITANGATITPTTFSYISGLSANIQTQIGTINTSNTSQTSQINAIYGNVSAAQTINTTQTSQISAINGNVNALQTATQWFISDVSTTNVLSQLRISETVGTVPTPIKGSLTLYHDNPGGTSSIVFPSQNNYNNDYAYISYKDDPNFTYGEHSLLTIGIENDPTNTFVYDRIALMSSGGAGYIGINKTTPLYSLDVSGAANFDSSITLNGNFIVNATNITPTQMSYVSGATSNIQTQINNITTVQTSGLYGNVITLQNTTATQTSQIEALYGNIISTQSINTTQTGHISAISGNIITLQNTTATQTGHISAISGNIITLQNTSATQTSQINAISGNIITLQNTTATQTAQIGAISGNIITLQNTTATQTGHISAISGNIITLQSKTQLLTSNSTASTISGKIIISESTGSVPSATSGSLTLSHQNYDGTSSIVFPSKNNLGSDYAYISYQDDFAGSGERSLLTIGIANDETDTSSYDRISIYTNGGNGYIGINTLTPEYGLDVNSACYLRKNTTVNGDMFKINYALTYNPVYVLYSGTTTLSNPMNTLYVANVSTNNVFIYLAVGTDGQYVHFRTINGTIYIYPPSGGTMYNIYNASVTRVSTQTALTFAYINSAWYQMSYYN